MNAFQELALNGLELYEREERNLNILFFSEILEHVAQVDHALSKDQGSVLLVGRSGVGRRTATSLVAHMRGMKFFTLNVQDNYTKKHFYAELKIMLACAGVENESVVFTLKTIKCYLVKSWNRSIHCCPVVKYQDCTNTKSWVLCWNLCVKKCKTSVVFALLTTSLFTAFEVICTLHWQWIPPILVLK